MSDRAVTAPHAKHDEYSSCLALEALQMTKNHRNSTAETSSHCDVLSLLGLRCSERFDNPLALHQLIVHGLPNKCLISLIKKTGLSAESLAPIFGISIRTCQRLANPKNVVLLFADQSGHLWLFAEKFAQAIAVMGTSELAIKWFFSPALSLNGHEPIELMTTYVGTQLVETILGRLDGGVYT